MNSPTDTTEVSNGMSWMRVLGSQSSSRISVARSSARANNSLEIGQRNYASQKCGYSGRFHIEWHRPQAMVSMMCHWCGLTTCKHLNLVTQTIKMQWKKLWCLPVSWPWLWFAIAPMTIRSLICKTCPYSYRIDLHAQTPLSGSTHFHSC